MRGFTQQEAGDDDLILEPTERERGPCRLRVHALTPRSGQIAKLREHRDSHSRAHHLRRQSAIDAIEDSSGVGGSTPPGTPRREMSAATLLRRSRSMSPGGGGGEENDSMVATPRDATGGATVTAAAAAAKAAVASISSERLLALRQANRFGHVLAKCSAVFRWLSSVPCVCGEGVVVRFLTTLFFDSGFRS
jgi:hypothetical protein